MNIGLKFSEALNGIGLYGKHRHSATPKKDRSIARKIKNRTRNKLARKARRGQ